MGQKVLLIDPSYGDYVQGYFKGCSSQIDTTIITKYWLEDESNKSIIKWFYKFTDKMKHGILRKVFRGFEYIYTYIRILFFLKKNYFDIVHIHWVVFPTVDKYFFRKIKKHCGKLIYTAHDVIPHVRPEESIETFREIYKIPDRIIVHGSGCEKEMVHFFPEVVEKMYVQEFGAFDRGNITSNSNDTIDANILKQINGTKGRIFLFIGLIYYNKGPDRIIKYWLENCLLNDDLLIVAGSIREMYPELEVLLNDLKDAKNIIFYPHFLPDNLHDYLYKSCDIVVMPYRHASMSGVLFSAAQFEKTVICTNEGSIPDYTISIPNFVYLCTNEQNDFEEKIKYIVENVSKDTLLQQGKKFSESIYNRFGWKQILKKVINKCYLS